ncbi:MAG: aminotransferase class I/II-fold pyridoxal phosphate-dependent enzyme [Bacteroidales bacterium]|nr:aminotransferase class I/II-fold pyridoxal phosphate-dependent enzyme [Bacteroidales bacterium]
MLLFRCDYAEGAHPEILRRLAETNFEQMEGYGSDAYSESARQKILNACGCPGGEVFLLSGGTQTNATVISALLEEYQGVVAVDTGHINVHESGAVEYTGHKVFALPQHDGKMDATELEAFLTSFDEDPNKDHMVWPGLVYISLPTEFGTIYSRSELTELQSVAHRHGLLLFIDGARLGYALACDAADFGLEDMKDLCDAFYIGGTKVGALCGEAVVFPKGGPRHFFTIVKQHGALLAKGRLLGVQFDTLFTDNLYLIIARNAIDRAGELVSVLKEKDIPFFLESPTNQQFVILENDYMNRLAEKVGFDIWQPHDATHTVVRFATSWASTSGQIEALSQLL